MSRVKFILSRYGFSKKTSTKVLRIEAGNSTLIKETPSCVKLVFSIDVLSTVRLTNSPSIPRLNVFVRNLSPIARLDCARSHCYVERAQTKFNLNRPSEHLAVQNRFARHVYIIDVVSLR